MKTIAPLRQKFIDHLTLRQLSQRTVQTYIHWVADLARFHKASPDALGRPEISSFVLHLIQERKLSDCSVTLAIKSLRAFYGLFPYQDVAVLFSGIRTPRRVLQLPRVFSPDEVEENECPRCGAAELQCIGRLDAHGKFTPLADGARRARIQLGEPPALGDTS
jgi:site-specific recombinase XerD